MSPFSQSRASQIHVHMMNAGAQKEMEERKRRRGIRGGGGKRRWKRRRGIRGGGEGEVGRGGGRGGGGGDATLLWSRALSYPHHRR